MTCCLHCVGMKRHAFFTADSAYIGDRIYRAYLVVGVHHGDKAGFVCYRVFDLLRGDGTVFIGIEQLNVKALCFESFKGTQNCVMLGFRGDDMQLVFLFACVGCGAGASVGTGVGMGIQPRSPSPLLS